jgi:hypothetical protein
MSVSDPKTRLSGSADQSTFSAGTLWTRQLSEIRSHPDIYRDVSSRVPPAQSADRQSEVSETGRLGCDPDTDVDLRGLRPPRGIAVAVLLSLVAWALLAIGVWWLI